MAQSISWVSLLWCLVPIGITWMICVSMQINAKEILTACLRMVIQLCAVGYVLVLIFSQPSITTSLFILAVMLIAATWISVRPLHHKKIYWQAMFKALSISVLFHLGLSVFLVLESSPWYEPQVLIPLAGMYFANTMNTVSLACERYISELANHNDQHKARNAAFNAALIPQVNGLLAVGLVSLPGMMTGQILAGVSPLIAVRYQILIMAMLLGASALAAALVLWQLKNSAKDVT